MCVCVCVCIPLRAVANTRLGSNHRTSRLAPAACFPHVRGPSSAQPGATVQLPSFSAELPFLKSFLARWAAGLKTPSPLTVDTSHLVAPN